MTSQKLREMHFAFVPENTYSIKLPAKKLMTFDSRYRLSSIQEVDEVKKIHIECDAEFFQEKPLEEDVDAPEIKMVSGGFKLGKIPN